MILFRMPPSSTSAASPTAPAWITSRNRSCKLLLGPTRGLIPQCPSRQEGLRQVARSNQSGPRRIGESTNSSAGGARQLLEPEKVTENLAPVLRQNTFGMELHNMNRILLVPNAHDLSFIGLGGDLKKCWQSIPFNHQRMIASGQERVRKPGKKLLSIGPSRRGLAVHHPVIHHYVGAEGVADALMPKAHPEQRQGRPERAND